VSVKTIAVIGTGKTGSEVQNILTNKAEYKLVPINRSHPLSLEVWKSVDAAICFLPGPAFLENFNFLITHPKPMVIGSTGFELSPPQERSIEHLSCPWVMSSNFSLGMALAKAMITQMAKWAAASGLSVSHAIEETHHVHKKDAPSGTALLWKSWATAAMGTSPAPIRVSSQRTEDHCGLHEYSLTLPQETMSFKHDAKSRAVFAEGAVWALEKILNDDIHVSGKIDFFDLISATIQEKD
jgi:4-hydroxy-tetrahydrodipicolinate reductase